MGQERGQERVSQQSQQGSQAQSQSAQQGSNSEGGNAKSRIMKLAGIDAEDVLGFNNERKTLVTSDGSKLKLDADGKTVSVLAGPVPAKLSGQAEED